MQGRNDPSSQLIQCRVTGGWNLSWHQMGKTGLYPIVRSYQFIAGLTHTVETSMHTHIHNYGPFKKSNNLTCMSLDGERKPAYLDETPEETAPPRGLASLQQLYCQVCAHCRRHYADSETSLKYLHVIKITWFSCTNEALEAIMFDGAVHCCV